jgi:hypothetical protein
MQLDIIQKSCPICQTKIKLGLMSINGEILRCPKCGQLLIDSPKRNLFGALMFALGFLSIGGLRHFWGSNIIRDLAILVVAGIFSVAVRKLTVTKKDLVIKNKQSGQVSFVDYSDWNEIVESSTGKENGFEIIEKL